MNERKEWGTHLGSPRIQTMTCLETQVSSISCVWYSGPSGFLQLLLEGWWPQTHGPMTPVSSQHSPCLGQGGRRQPVPSLSQGPSAGHRDLSSATGLGLAGHSRFCFLTGSGGMKIWQSPKRITSQCDASLLWRGLQVRCVLLHIQITWGSFENYNAWLHLIAELLEVGPRSVSGSREHHA